MTENATANEEFKGYQFFKPGYGVFPYIIWKVAYATFMQIPIHIVNKNDEEPLDLPGGKLAVEKTSNLSKQELIEKHEHKLIEMVKVVSHNMEVDKGKPRQLCLVCAPNKAFYFDDNKIKKNESIPSKGNLLSMDNEPIGMAAEHFLENQND